MHIPGKSIVRNIAANSRHRWTRARIVKAAAKAQEAGNASQAHQLWSMLSGESAGSPPNQRQRRKAKRALHAAGVRNAFA